MTNIQRTNVRKILRLLNNERAVTLRNENMRSGDINNSVIQHDTALQIVIQRLLAS